MTKIDPTPIDEAVKAMRQAQDEMVRLRKELHLMQTAGIIEVAVRNPSVMEYMQHWEGRAEKAEAELAKVREVNAEQANQIDALKRLLAECSGENEHLRGQLRQAQQRARVARSGE